MKKKLTSSGDVLASPDFGMGIGIQSCNDVVVVVLALVPAGMPESAGQYCRRWQDSTLRGSFH